MKLFQQLLVAPAALGLMAPIAATAAELNFNDVSNYSASGAETQSISDFSDVYPSDWAYKALNNLRKRSGCTAISPSGSMTRYEAAALLNQCLSNLAEVNEEEQSLIDEFSAELAVIKGRLDVLGNDITGFEAGAFSTTTKLSGRTTFVVGGVSTNEGLASASTTAAHEAVTFHYDTALDLDSSFTGRDLLKNRIRVGNFVAADPFGSGGQATLETNNGTTADVLTIDRSYYKFPVKDNFEATIGAKVRQDDMLGVWPSAYPTDAVLDILTYAGASSVYSLKTGAGAGLTYTNDNWVASALFVSEDAADASSQEATAGGILTAHGRDSITTQLAWVDDGFTIAAGYTSNDNGNWDDNVDTNDYTAWTIGGIYDVDGKVFGLESEWLPTSISAGIGWHDPENEDSPDTAANTVEELRTWTVGLMWNDAFLEGNNLGFGIGTAEGHREDNGYDDPLAWELFYQMQVSDNITVTPAVFVINRDNERNDDITGALVKTTFSF